MKNANLNQFYAEMEKANVSPIIVSSLYYSLAAKITPLTSIAEEKEIISDELLKLKKAIQSTFINS